jgi:hypothetical protein
MNEWKIQSYGAQCTQCGKPFGNKESYRTLLFESGEDLMRQDICLVCWSHRGDQSGLDESGLISTWKGTYKTPPPRPKEAIQKDQAENILLQIVHDRNLYPAHPGTLYILSAMLERKRNLKLRDTVQKSSKRLFVYEHIPTGDVFSIDDVKLSTDEWATVYQEVSGVLSVGLDYFGSLIPQEKLNHEIGNQNSEGFHSATISTTSGEEKQTQESDPGDVIDSDDGPLSS